MSRRRGRSFRREVANLLLLAGLMGIGIWGWWTLRGKVYQDWANWTFDRRLHNQSTTIPEYLAAKRDEWLGHRPAEAPVAKIPTPAPGPTSVPAVPPKPVEPAPRIPENGEMLGRLVVPRLNLTAVVREGTDSKVLGVALGHIPGTALPGTNGNVAVAGHRDTLFRALRNIRKNDVIEFQTLDGTYRYQVDSTSIVLPKKVDVLKSGAEPEMTLVTCWPFDFVGSAPDRFIVKAKQIDGPKVPKLEVAAAAPAAVPPPPAVEPPLPEPVKPAPVQSPSPVKRAPAKVAAQRHAGRIPFQLTAGHSRYLAPGISLGLSRLDARSKRVNGWMWVMPDRRTIWLRDQSIYQPVIFYGRNDGRRRELVITNVNNQSVSGYLVLPSSD